MTKAAGMKHVESNSIGELPRIVSKGKSCIRINKFANQPSRRNTVDPRPGACQPSPVQIFLSQFQCTRRSARREPICDIEHALHATAQWTVEEVNCDNL